MIKTNYIKKTSLTNGTRFLIKFSGLNLEVYIVDGIRMGKSSAYRRGTRSLGETEIFAIVPTGETDKSSATKDTVKTVPPVKPLAGQMAIPLNS